MKVYAQCNTILNGLGESKRSKSSNFSSLTDLLSESTHGQIIELALITEPVQSIASLDD